MEEGPYVLEILRMMVMMCQFRFTKSVTERGENKLFINFVIEKSQNFCF